MFIVLDAQWICGRLNQEKALIEKTLGPEKK